MQMLDSILDFFFPRYCPCCGERLGLDERPICIKCNMGLPRTYFWESPYDNSMAKMFYGRLYIEKAAAYFWFSSKTDTASIVYDAKYHGRRDIPIQMGEMMADEMGESFFSDIDCLFPLPLTIRRRLKRGYNQSEMMARGISNVTHIPIVKHAVIRCKFEKSQTHLTSHERQENVEKVFQLKDPQILAGKHVLLIDDVITTGATSLACAREIMKSPGVRVSILSLAYAGIK